MVLCTQRQVKKLSTPLWISLWITFRPVDKSVDNPVDNLWISQMLSTPLGPPVDKMWITLPPPVDNFSHAPQGFFDLFSKLSTDFIHYNY